MCATVSQTTPLKYLTTSIMKKIGPPVEKSVKKAHHSITHTLYYMLLYILLVGSLLLFVMVVKYTSISSLNCQ